VLSAALALCASEPNLVRLLGLELAIAERAVAVERERLIGRLAELPSARVQTGSGLPTVAVTELLAAAALGFVVERIGGPGTPHLSELGTELAQLLTAATPI
jgi:hypothetical protein